MGSAEPPTIRVVVVDDHPIMREGLDTLLRGVPDVSLVGNAATGADALRQVERLQPDVLILDLGLPDMSGVEVARRVTSSWPNVSVLVLTGIDPARYVAPLTRLGVRGIVRKTAPTEELVSAIRLAARGSELPRRREPRASRGESPQGLTQREIAVLRWIASGHRNTEIAEGLHVTLNTVEYHVRNILTKLGARSRTEAIFKARALGYVLTEEEPLGGDP